MLSIFLSAAVGQQVPGQEHKGHYLQLFPVQPKARAHSRGTQSPEGTVSSSETGYSIRVTPTCKTETIALTKLPLQWGSSTSQAPAWEGRVTGQAGWVLLP